MNYFSSSVLATLTLSCAATSQITAIDLSASGLTPLSIDDVVIADFDGDGDGDLAVAFQTAAAAFVCVLYNTTGTGLSPMLFANAPSFVLLPATSASPIELFAGPVTPGSIDLVAYGDPGGAPYLQVLTNPGGTGPWTSTAAGVAPILSDIEASDRDGDGDLDLIGLVAGATSDTLQVYDNVGGVFSAGVAAAVAAGSLGGVGLLAIGSLDGNSGNDDVLIYTANAANPGQIQTLVDNTLGPYAGAAAFVAGPIYPGIPAISSILLADLTGDGLDDATLYLGGFNVYLTNVAAPPTVPPVAFLPVPGAMFLNANSGIGPGVLAAGDIDGDGDQDIIDGNATAGTVQINLGGGVFAGGTGPLPAPVSTAATGAINMGSTDDIAVGFSPGSLVLVVVN